MECESAESDWNFGDARDVLSHSISISANVEPFRAFNAVNPKLVRIRLALPIGCTFIDSSRFYSQVQNLLVYTGLQLVTYDCTSVRRFIKKHDCLQC